MANTIIDKSKEIVSQNEINEEIEHEGYFSAAELRKQRINKIISSTLIYIFLTLMALFILFPFYWMFATAIKSEVELLDVSLIPKSFQFSNFKKAFTHRMVWIEAFNKEIPGFLVYYMNTILVAILTTVGTMVTTILAAFAFSKFNFKGKNVIFSLMLATMMVPGEIFIITNYGTIANLGLLETYWAMVLPFVTSVFYIFFLRQTFMQIPNELYLAAKVDGTTDFKYLLKIMIPIAKATLTTILILSMMGTWNAYIWPNLVADHPPLHLVSNGLMKSFSVAGAIQENIQMAAAALVSLPLLIAFIFLKKYIMRGVSRSGIKG